MVRPVRGKGYYKWSPETHIFFSALLRGLYIMNITLFVIPVKIGED